MKPPAPNIFVRDLRLQARVGVNPGEDEANQPVALDIWVGVDQVERAANSQRLRDTVDYVGIARAARKVVEARHYPLVETLATRVAEAVLGRPGAAWVRVRLRKLKCLRHAAAAGVEVELHRGDLVAGEHPEPVLLPGDSEEEIVIVGGGVAGLAAALWCQRLGHPALLVDDGQQLGGQLHLVHGRMTDLAAMPPMTGIELARRLWRQLAEHDGRWTRGRLVGIEPGSAQDLCRLELDSSCRLGSRAVILCTGVRRRALGVPGERELLGRGVLHTGARNTERLRDRHVAVVGGGDAACENAMILARAGARVTLVHHTAMLTAREQFRTGVAETAGAVDLRLETRVLRFLGQDQLEALVLHAPDGEQTIAVDAALVRIGWVPNSEGLPSGWLDERGFVRADPDGRVREERRVFVAGDVTGRLAPSVATAYGSAAVAVRAAVHLLELSV